MGHSAPIITSAVHSDSPEAVQIDFEVRWVGDMGAKGVLDLKTRFGRRMSVTVSDITVTATVRLALAPLVSVAPGFSAASFSLLSRPMVRPASQPGRPCTRSLSGDSAHPPQALHCEGCGMNRLSPFLCVSVSQVRYRLTGVSAASAALPDLNAFLTRALADCACAAALWPRRIIIPVIPDFDPSTLIPQPAGVLRVVVLCALRVSAHLTPHGQRPS